jgi:Flp pilus assembly protein TadB
VAEAPTAHGDAPPPPTEEIHLPGPSYLPVLVAVGVTLVLVGLVLTPVVLAIGAVIAVVSVVIWIRQTREDIAELPLEH